MNDIILMEGASSISENTVERFLRYEEKIKARANFFSLRHLKIAAVACVCAIIASFSAVTILNNFIGYVRFDELSAIEYVEGAPSLSGFLSPRPSGAIAKQLTDEQIKTLFQKDVNDLFGEKPKSVKGEMICYPDGMPHTVRITWIFEDGYLMTVIDPDTLPEFVFSTVDEEKINGYKVGVIYYSDVITNGEFVKDTVCIGMNKDEMGILINAPASCEKRAEEVFNYILNFEFDLSGFEN